MGKQISFNWFKNEITNKSFTCKLYMFIYLNVYMTDDELIDSQ